MRVFELGTIIIVLLAGANLLDWVAGKAKAAPQAQCLVQANLPDGSPVQRWRVCTQDEITATT